MAVDLKVLGEKLGRYRSHLQVTLNEVSEGTGIAVDSLEAFETGDTAPTGDQLLILADYFKCDYLELISPDAATPLERTETLFRRFGTAFSKRDRWSVREFLYLCESEFVLQEQLSQARTQPFVFIKRGTYFKRHAEEAASTLRRKLEYPDHIVPRDVYADLRGIGIHVFRRRLDNSNISGLYMSHPLAGDCVLVNYNEDVYRQRFTAAHEGAHAIFDRSEEVVVSFWDDNDLKEIRANTFASRYLMPPPFLRRIPDSSNWNRAKLLKWSHDLRVNPTALLFALSEEGLITKAEVDRMKDVKVPYARKVDPELPASLAPKSRERKKRLLERGLSTQYVSLCFAAYRENLVTASKLVELMLLEGDEELRDLAQLYGEALEYGG